VGEVVGVVVVVVVVPPVVLDVGAVLEVVAEVGVVDILGVVVGVVVDVDALSQADISDRAATTAPPVVAPILSRNWRLDTFSAWVFFLLLGMKASIPFMAVIQLGVTAHYKLKCALTNIYYLEHKSQTPRRLAPVF
jgi:hypothetical protein